MKLQIRVPALLLCLCLTFSLSSCMVFGKITDTMLDMMEDFTTGDENNGPATDAPSIAYTLTDADHTKFTQLLATCEALVLEGTDIPAIEEALDAMEAQYYHIATQAGIAYLLYCCDMRDKELSEAQLYASQMQDEVYSEYMAFTRAVDASDSPYRETFFAEWTEVDLAIMNAYTDEMTLLSQAYNELLVEYHELDLEDADDLAKVESIYLELLGINDKQADIMGYESYYDYASELACERYSTDADRVNFRNYVASYILPLYRSLAEEFDALREDLSYTNYLKVYSLLFDPYDDLRKDYVSDYVSSYPSNIRQKMKAIFDSENSIWTNDKDAYNGAFTTYLYAEERPFCYFGADYQEAFTVVHEMGHYYAGCFNAISDVPLDLSEVHSQANEFLFLRSLRDSFSEEVYRVIELYQVLDTLAVVIISTVIDEFEEYVYENYELIIQNEISLDSIMDDICETYGGADMLGREVADMNRYWKYVVLDSPVYYISYALSATVAISIYDVSIEDEDGAREIFLSLAEELDADLTFREIIAAAGLPDPYAQSTFISICDCFS